MKKNTHQFLKESNKISNEVLCEFKLDIHLYTYNGDISGMMNSLEIRNPFLELKIN